MSDALTAYRYPDEIRSGVYDFARLASVKEMVGLLRAASKTNTPDTFWVNRECGLKPRKWPETKAALINIVAAAHYMRP
ncbi:hypothetical protein [Gluconobacter frateurii]|uniref:Cobalamin-independent methionine synthase MetE C-terminal/archaeal domain-containing protein n=1 Tax=Gluconobacter frateurii NRIC 0228 TaxID=1307946 RepID=A0ABQ0Q826_9PROT|nr:hypothetical protein [Gluconobacter frateurii]GBR08525.1 hypothetical protein AA0228_0371 [Gluconobacter frateurii NRIC 0228]GLP91060.1 hypothetical protein GCM10007868_21350 [Gluconobacter frateurii]